MEETAPYKKKNYWYVYLISILILLVLVFLLSLPSILSTDLGKSYIEDILSNKLKGKVEIESLDFSWRKGQKVVGFDYVSNNNSASLSFEEISVNQGLFKFLTNRAKTASTTIKEPVLKIDISSISFSESEKEKNSLLALFLYNSHIEDAYVYLYGREQEKVEFSKLYLDFTSKEESSISLNIRSKSNYNDTSGNIEFKGNLISKRNLVSLLKQKRFNEFLSSIEYELQLNAKNFPTLGLDELFAFKNSKTEEIFKELFGPLVSIQGTSHMKASALDLDVNAQSQNLNFTVQTKQTPGFITLSKPATATITLTPKIFEKIQEVTQYGKYLKLTKQGGIQFILDSIKIPTTPSEILYRQYQYQARMFSSSLNFIAQGLDNPITISSFKATSSSSGEKDPFSLNLQCGVNYLGKNPSNINTSFKLQRTELTENNTLVLLTDLDLEINKFPLAFVDAIFTKDNRLVTFLGETLNAKIKSATKSDKLEYTLSIDTPRLHIPELIASCQDSIYLDKPAKLTYNPNVGYLQQLLDTPYFTIGQVEPFTGQIEAIGLSLDDFKDSLFKKLVFQANIFSNSFNVNSSFLFGKFIFSKLHFDIHADMINQLKLGIDTTLKFSKITKSEEVIWGEDLQTTLNAFVDLTNIHNIQVPMLQGIGKSDRAKIVFDLALHDNLSKLVFKSPLSFEILPTNELIKMIFKDSNKLITYVPYIPIEATLKAKPIYFNKPIFDDLAFTADLSLKKFDVVNKEWYREFSFYDSKCQISADSKKGIFNCELQTEATTKNDTAGIFNAKLVSTEFTSSDFLRKNLNLKINAEKCLTQVVDTILGFNESLVDVLGINFDMNLDITGSDMNFTVQKEFNSPNLYAHGEFYITPNSFEIQNKDFKINYLFNKTNYAALEKLLGNSTNPNTNFELTYATVMYFTLKNLYLPRPFLKPNKLNPLFAKQLINELNYNLSKSQFSLEASADNIVFTSLQDRKATSLEDLRIDLTKSDITNPFIFNLTSQVKEKTKNVNTSKGSIAASGTLTTKRDNKDTPTLNTVVNAKLTNFPTMLLDSFFHMATKVQTSPSILLGDNINASLEAKLDNLTGYIDFDIDSMESKANVNAFLTDGVLKLAKPIHASFKITKKLADHVLKNMNISLYEAKNPLEIYVQDKGFYFPLDPFDLSKVQVRYASANLGQITCNNLGSPRDVGGFFKLNLSSSSMIYLWFAPMDFSISNGYMNIDRTEVLYDRAYQIAYWGRINLMKKYVNMTLGLTEQSLNKAFGIKTLPKSFVLQIPMEGPIGDVRINKDVATARIAFLIAKSSGITKQKGIWGGVVDMLGEMANDQGAVPRPKPPFPWETSWNELEEKASRKTTVNIMH